MIDRIVDSLLAEAAGVEGIDVDTVQPEGKDEDRAHMITSQGKADSQAKAITDPLKLVRRAKAMVLTHGTGVKVDPEDPSKSFNAWQPFRAALERMGFSQEQIQAIEYTGSGSAKKPTVPTGGGKRHGSWSILPIGSVNIQTGANRRLFNVYDQWFDHDSDTTVVVAKASNGAVKAIWGAGGGSYAAPGDEIETKHDQTFGRLFDGTVVGEVNFNGRGLDDDNRKDAVDKFKWQLRSMVGKSSVASYVFK